MSGDVFRLQRRLQQASQMGVAPALALSVSRGTDGDVTTWYAGTLDDCGNGQCSDETIFDLASLTKPLTTTLWCLRLVDAGQLDLEERIGKYVAVQSSELAQCPVWRLLSHTTGLPAHHAYYRGLGPHALEKGSHQNARAAIQRMVLSSTLQRPPGESEIYSDIGYLCLEMVCESVDKPLANAWRNLPGHSEQTLHYRPVAIEGDTRHVAATERCSWRKRLIQGQVHDDNCWTMGGIAGHAGLFGRLLDVHHLAQQWLNAVHGRTNTLGLDRELIQRVIDPRHMHQNGTRVLGWDTPSPGASSAGRHFGRRSIGHLGFTGTSLWIDSDAEVIVTLLTNRVCPSRDDTRIRALRPEIHNLVRTSLGAT